MALNLFCYSLFFLKETKWYKVKLCNYEFISGNIISLQRHARAQLNFLRIVYLSINDKFEDGIFLLKKCSVLIEYIPSRQVLYFVLNAQVYF